MAQARMRTLSPEALVFLNPFGKAMGHQIQHDVVLKNGLEARERPTKPFRRLGYLFHY
jgi:hypothetical protein